METYEEELERKIEEAFETYWLENMDDLDPFRIGEYRDAFNAGATWERERTLKIVRGI